MKKSIQTFCDGLVSIYSVGNGAESGDLPKDSLTRTETLRFRRRTVGLTRSNLALQAGVTVDGLLRCPYRLTVSPQDVAVVDGVQYRISKVQRPEEISPPVMDLELVRLENVYEIR